MIAKIQPFVIFAVLLLISACRYDAITDPTEAPKVPELAILPCDSAACSCSTLRDTPNDTGIATALTSSGSLVPCSENNQTQDCAVGRDANTSIVKQGYGEAGFDFNKISLSGELLTQEAPNWHCVLDHVTGLMWETKWQANPDLIGHGSESFTWFNALLPLYQATSSGQCNLNNQCTTADYIDYINASRLCGYSDWRMPNKLELQQLMQYQHTAPALSQILFNGVLNTRYWSSTIDSNDQDTVWSVNFEMGTTTSETVNNANALLLVRQHTPPYQAAFTATDTERIQSLRVVNAPNQSCNANASFSAPIDRFRLTNSGDIFDRKTGLIWRPCVLGRSGEDCTTGTEEVVSWQQALSLASAQRESNSAQWRLPNIKELNSLIETACEAPALNPVVFPNMVLGRIWSATPNIHSENTVYYVQSQNGSSSYQSQNNTAMVQLVTHCQE